MSIDNFEVHPGRYISGVKVKSYSKAGIAPPLIGVVNYKAGNILSISKALNLLGANTYEVLAPADIGKADGLVMPGVGAFSAAMACLVEQGLAVALKEYALVQKRMLMGICLGMQLLTDSSMEFGVTEGLSIIPGETKELDRVDVPLPHVGWNEVAVKQAVPMYAGIPDQAHFYFDHSFAVNCAEKYISGSSDYGQEFVASICHDNIWAAQFHPEKSQTWGLKLLRNFLDTVVGVRDNA